MIIKNTLLFLFITFIVTTSVNAQDPLSSLQIDKPELLAEVDILPDVKLQPKTHPEKIIFTQIKLAKDKPDYDRFAKASPNVANAQDIDKNAMALSEYNRISNSFNLHDEKAPLSVQTQVQADEYSSLQNMIIFDEFDKTSFFQFNAYGHHVGIVPEDMEKYSKLALSKLNAERFFRILGGNKNITAEFILVPTYSDNKDPIAMKGKNVWLMFARVGEFRLWSQDENPELLWYHRANWYAPQDNTNIQDLYAQP